MIFVRKETLRDIRIPYLTSIEKMNLKWSENIKNRYVFDPV